jgi:hypothetical protein
VAAGLSPADALVVAKDKIVGIRQEFFFDNRRGLHKVLETLDGVTQHSDPSGDGVVYTIVLSVA